MEGYGNPTVLRAGAQKTSRRRACDNCARRRSRCDGKAPCEACRLHNTEATCGRGIVTAHHTTARKHDAGRSHPTRSCQNCWRRKSKCDRGVPCTACVLHGKQDSCYVEQGIQRSLHTSTSSSASTSSLAADDGDAIARPPHSTRACFNCWHRKNKCDKQKPCSSCAFHGCSDTCFVELDKDDHSAHSIHARRVMREKRHERAKSKLKTKGDDVGAEQSNGVLLHDVGRMEVVQQAGSTCTHAVMDAIARLPPLYDVATALALIGDTELANDWPTVDRDVLRVIYDKLLSPHLHDHPDAIELAYVYALLAVCTIALPLLHPYKISGAFLHPSCTQTYVAATTALMESNADPTFAVTATPLLECRVFHALSWSAIYGGRPVDAHYFSEQAILSARMADILDGLPPSHATYTRQGRATVCDLVLEVSSLAFWISFAANAPTSMPPLPPDVRKHAMTRDDGAEGDLDTLPVKWRAWKVHSSGWMGHVLRYLRDIAAKHDDGTPVWSTDERDAYATRLIVQMEQDEREIDARTGLLHDAADVGGGAGTDAAQPPPLENALQMRRTNAKAAAQFTTNILRDMLTSHTFQAARLDVGLSRTALFAAQRILSNFPMLLSLFRSQYDFPPLRLFMSRMFESSMQTTFHALCRLQDVQQDATLAGQAAWLIRAAPGMYRMMNERGVAGPTSLAVLSMCQSVPIHRAPPPSVLLGTHSGMPAQLDEYDDDTRRGGRYATSAVAAATRIEARDEVVHGQLYH